MVPHRRFMTAYQRFAQLFYVHPSVASSLLPDTQGQSLLLEVWNSKRTFKIVVCNVFWLMVTLTVQVANFVLVCHSQEGDMIPLMGRHKIKQSADIKLS